jgi:hypothetical protein
MSKYYIISGELEAVIAGPHISCPRQAAIEAVLTFKNKSLAPLMIISERGFDVFGHDEAQDIVLATVDILKESGMIGE